jgi:DNA-binding NarL/FixJ family response regulator
VTADIAGTQDQDEAMLNYADSLSALGLYSGRISGSVVGRPQELAALERGLEEARRGMYCLAFEGEPGIGKTRLLLAVDELARNGGFVTLAVTADEEIQGPFLVARSIFASASALEAAEGTGSEQALARVIDALSSRDDPGLEALSPDRKLLRVFDLAAVALRSLAAEKPVALIIDDLQWADDDSLRLLRYVVRVAASSRVLLALAMRSSEIAFIGEANTLLADIERLGILRRLKVGRFSQLESTEMLQQVLGGRIDLTTAALMHAQAEGVPFVLAEQAHAYRDAGLVQQIDGVWTLARNAERMVPSAVQTLIRRRSAHLNEASKSCLSVAAILGRSFSLRDLSDVKQRLNDELTETADLADSLAPAVAAGLLVQLPSSSAADYSFTHDQIRQHEMQALPPPRRRAVHAAVVAMLTANGDTPDACLSMLAQHAVAAGMGQLAAQSAIRAAEEALDVRAPEEALRLVELAQPVASSALDRVALLRLRDDALDMLRRPSQRLQGLTELTALAEALGDSAMELDVLLRRSDALRLSNQHDEAVELAQRVQQLAVERQDQTAELAAWLELGQALMRSEIGEGYTQTPTEADLDGAEEAYKAALALAEHLGDESSIAAASRELGIIGISRVRAWVINSVSTGVYGQIMQRVAAGERFEDILPSLEIAPIANEASSLFLRALDIYERLGNRQGAMSTIIAMAFITWGAEIHLGGSAKRIEALHRLVSRMKSFTKESEQALAEAQMLFGAHVYSRSKVFPDVALAKGSEAFAAARTLGDRNLEFAAAGGTALVHAELGDHTDAERWLERAAQVAASEPTPLRARQLAAWRGIISEAKGDAGAMREHLEHAVQLATDRGSAAARCETLALLAIEAAHMASGTKNEELLALAERSAMAAKRLVSALPGHPLWGAQADAALASVHLARGQLSDAAEAGRAAMSALQNAMIEDVRLDILLPASRAILAAGSEDEKAGLTNHLRLVLAFVAQHTLDEDVRVRWFRSPVGRELTELVGRLEGPLTDAATTSRDGPVLADIETGLLKLLAEGRTNREIAESLDTDEQSVSRRLAELFTKIGVSSRAEATATALMGRLI